jgi:hypothetical protein
MVPVTEIWEEVQQITGNSRDDFNYRRLTDSVELLANKGDFDPLDGYLDICVQDMIVTLPPEVETIRALNMAGNPAVARDGLFKFHLNGPGQFGPTLEWEWVDLGVYPTYWDIQVPKQLIATCQDSRDTNCDFWVYGFDDKRNVIRTETTPGNWVDGYKIPVFTTQQALPPNAPTFGRITRVRKAKTNGPVELQTLDGVKLGVYQPNETEPRLRRIRLSQKVDWVRISFRRKVFKVQSQYDLLPVNNSQAVLMMLRAIQLYPKDPGTAEALEATAVRWATEEQRTSNAPVAQPFEVQGINGLVDQDDYVD